MLKDFKVSNFRTLYNELDINMNKENVTELPDHLIEKKYLPVKLILGGNATGKTNTILAIEVLKNIIVNKGIYSKNKKIYSNYSLFSNINDKKKYVEPIKFYINFTNNSEYKYYLYIRNNIKHETIIEYEKLFINDLKIFERHEKELNINYTEKTKKYFKDVDKSYIENTEKMFNNETINHAGIFISYLLFLKDIINDFDDYFNNKLITISSFNNVNKFKIDGISIDDDDKININNNLYKKIIKLSDFGNQKIFLRINRNQEKEIASKPELLSKYKMGKEELTVSSFLTESSGTLKLLQYFPYINEAIKMGKTLIVDELDSSINPVIIVGLINLFTNNEINKKGAQLIFTTHNPVYLANDLLRRDEIEILEKDENTLTTVGYTIADIKGVRKGESLLKNYLAGKYGPIHEINFEKIIKPIYNFKADEDIPYWQK